LTIGRRGLLDIIGSILQALSDEPLKKTQLSYKANLDFRSLNKYLKLLNNLELIQSYSKEKDDSLYFTITEGGRYFLKNYQVLVDIVEGYKARRSIQ